jgi:hypothetical protein
MTAGHRSTRAFVNNPTPSRNTASDKRPLNLHFHEYLCVLVIITFTLAVRLLSCESLQS